LWVLAARNRLNKLINTQNCAAFAHCSFADSLGDILRKLREKSQFGKIGESVTSSLKVILFNNATAGGTVNLNVLRLDLYKE
jgi:hypothetical protein